MSWGTCSRRWMFRAAGFGLLGCVACAPAAAPAAAAEPAPKIDSAAAPRPGDAPQPAPAAAKPAAPADKAPSSASAFDALRPEIRAAAETFQKGQVDEALKLLTEAAAANPDLAPGTVTLSHFYAQAGQVAAARRMLERAVVEFPDDPQAYVALAEYSVGDGGLMAAELLLRRAQELLTPFDKSIERKRALGPQILAGLATVAERRGDFATAQKYLESWVALEPKSINVHQRLGRVFFQARKPEQALKEFALVNKLDEKFLPEASLAMLYQAVGDVESASQWMSAALKARPLDAPTQIAAGHWALQAENYEQARDRANAALQLAPDSVDAKFLRGLVGLFLHDYADAEKYLQAALKQDPSSFAVSNNLALALAQQDDEAQRKRGLEYAQLNVQRHPRSAEAFATLGWALYRLGQRERAEQALANAAAAGRVEPDTAYYMARLAVDRGQKDYARQMLQAALRSTAPGAMRHDAAQLLQELGEK